MSSVKNFVYKVMNKILPFQKLVIAHLVYKCTYKMSEYMNISRFHLNTLPIANHINMCSESSNQHSELLLTNVI